MMYVSIPCHLTLITFHIFVIYILRMEARIKKQAQTIDRLSAELDSLVSNPQSEEAKENSKLKYQISQLQKAIAEERNNLKPLEGISLNCSKFKLL